jgi:alkanesulfonate monooxygenase SsuD/methylene tetrahydromethanopterin reductase-like flavin-dependent oxidoreductase (luciferase family)
VLVAKQALTIDHLSGGRLVLGAAPGGRPDDFEASGAPSTGAAGSSSRCSSR